jgi:tRNA(Arg) A34 adenosine deaminase TadA
MRMVEASLNDLNETAAARDRMFMELALAEALKAQALGEVPIGALVVYEGRIIGRGFNCAKPATIRPPTPR